MKIWGRWGDGYSYPSQIQTLEPNSHCDGISLWEATDMRALSYL